MKQIFEISAQAKFNIGKLIISYILGSSLFIVIAAQNDLLSFEPQIKTWGLILSAASAHFFINFRNWHAFTYDDLWRPVLLSVVIIAAGLLNPILFTSRPVLVWFVVIIIVLPRSAFVLPIIFGASIWFDPHDLIVSAMTLVSLFATHLSNQSNRVELGPHFPRPDHNGMFSIYDLIEEQEDAY